MSELKLGVDASEWNRPDWSAIRDAGVDFVILRANCGTTIDKLVREHVRQARLEAFQIGLYSFFRPHQDPGEQFGVFLEVDELVGYEPADIIPALDVERDPGAPPELREVSPAWSAPAQLCSDLLAEQYGKSQTYITRLDWVRLGRPQWVLDRPIWVAHWDAKSPAMPGEETWHIWQNHVGPMPGSLGKPIDQNVAESLVLIPHPGPLGMTRGEQRRVEGAIASTLDTSYRKLPRP